MLELGTYLFFSLYGGVIASIIYINTRNRNNNDLLDQDIEPIPSRFRNRERMTVGERFV